MEEDKKPRRTLAERCGDAVDVTIGIFHVALDGRAYLVLGAFVIGYLSNTQIVHDLCSKLWSMFQHWVHTF